MARASARTDSVCSVGGKQRPATGIRVRHARDCPGASACRCRPTYQAWVYSAREQKRQWRTFPTLAAAKGWRADATAAVRRGTLTVGVSETVAEAATNWLRGAESGVIRTRSGSPYKPSALRGYEAALRLRILPAFGGRRLNAVQRIDVQEFVDGQLASGADPSTIKNTLMPLRAIYRRALARGLVAVNPTTGIEVPATQGRRDRIVSPAEAARLLKALPESDRPLWATAAFAGLRVAELQALSWTQVDLDHGLIRVERSWDRKAGYIDPKSRAGARSVPIPSALRVLLAEHRLRTGGRGLVFGRTEDDPFDPSSVRARAHRVWADMDLQGIGFHELRHTYASFLISAGVNAKAVTTYLGHSSVITSFDRYGKLMPGNESEAASQLDSFLSEHTEAL